MANDVHSSGPNGAAIEQMAPGPRPMVPPPPTQASVVSPTPVALKQRRGWRPGLLLFGLILVVGSMLGGLLLFDSVTTTTRVLVAAEDLNRGQVLTVGDVRVAEVAVPPDVLALELDDQSFLGGESADQPVRVLKGFVPGGSILTKEHFIEQGEVLSFGQALAGVRLETGQYPSTLKVGDTVEIFSASPRNAEAEAVYIGRAEVFTVWQAVSEDDRTEDLIADLLISVDLEAAVLQAQSEGMLLLTLMAEGQG